MILEGFNARLVLIDSAQAFHWVRVGDGYAAAVRGEEATLTPVDGGYRLSATGEPYTGFWREYFDLDRDYTKIAESCAAYPAAVEAMRLLPDMRVLNQPPWEALIAFILSANNHVSRIRGLVLALCASYGDAVGDGGLHGFPSPTALAVRSEGELRALGAGYRAPYLLAAARAVTEGFPLDSLRSLPYGEAKAALMTLRGVGPKVADCVLLFGCRHARAFPVDVWIERFMRDRFGLEGVRARELPEIAYRMFGDSAGIVQQSLFHCARLGLT